MQNNIKNKHSIQIVIITIILLSIFIYIAYFVNPIFFIKSDYININSNSLLEKNDLYNKFKQSNNEILYKDNGISINSKSSFHFNFKSNKKEKIPLYIVAKGKSLKNVYPFLSFKIYPYFTKGMFITSDNWGLYKILLDVKNFSNFFEIAFLNDDISFQEDRNIDILKLKFGSNFNNFEKYIRWITPCFIPPYKISVQKFCNVKNKDIKLWVNGEISDDIYFNEKGKHTIFIKTYKNNAFIDSGQLSIYQNNKIIQKIEIKNNTSNIKKLNIKINEGFNNLKIKNTSIQNDSFINNDILIEGIWVDTKPTNLIKTKKRLIIKNKTTICNNFDFDLCSTGKQLHDSWGLFTNGYITKKFYTNFDKKLKIIINAKGDLIDKIGPKILVIIDNNQEALFNINSRNFKQYIIPSIKLKHGEHKIVIIYDNDKFLNKNKDINFYLKHIEFIKLDE